MAKPRENEMNVQRQHSNLTTPEVPPQEAFSDATAAVDRLIELYDIATEFLCREFSKAMHGDIPATRVRAYYPEVRITTTSYCKIDSRLSFGHVSEPGTHVATITRPTLFRNYLEQQIGLLLENHGVPVQRRRILHADAGAFCGCRRPVDLGAS